MDKTQFHKDIAYYVKKYAPFYDIVIYSPIIAQSILESDWGTSALATDYHNYFGLKCGSTWTGASVNLTTREETAPDTLTTTTDNFRVYSCMAEGVSGYFDFIQLARYQNLKGITSPREYLETIKADGYCTDSNYVDKCMAIVEQYELTQYDEENQMATEFELRERVATWLNGYKGVTEGSTGHKEILSIFNDSGLCSRYKMTTSDAWCATAVSAAFIACGLANIFPCVECSCYYMLTLAQKAGIWVEDDSFVPDVGDVILYDWDDNGNSDNTGYPDHVGIVQKVSGITLTVIEGNKSNTVGTRTIQVNGLYIRGFITPNYVSAVEVRSGWVLETGGWRYYLGDTGKCVTNDWHQDSDGKWYWFNGAGYMVANTWYLYHDKWYYLGADGAMMTGQVTDNDLWYVMDDSGAMITTPVMLTPDDNGALRWSGLANT